MRQRLLVILGPRAAAAAFLVAGVAMGAEARGAGATFQANLYAAWVEAFAEASPDQSVSYDPVGSGEGIRRFVNGAVDFGGTDRPLDDAQIDAVEGGVLHVPATAGMVVVAYNIPGLSDDLRLSRTVLGGIFAGEIREWDDPLIAADNPGISLPHRSIAVVARRDSSGTTYAFSSHLAEMSDVWRISGRGAGMIIDWPGGAMTAPGNEGVAGRIAISEYSLGYVEYSFARELDLPVALLENKAGAFVRPTAAAGSAALAAEAAEMPADGRQQVLDPPSPDAYPIVTYSWLLLHEHYADPEVARVVKDFVSWGLQHGQALAEPIGYVPLPPEVVARANELVEMVK